MFEKVSLLCLAQGLSFRILGVGIEVAVGGSFLPKDLSKPLLFVGPSFLILLFLLVFSEVWRFFYTFSYVVSCLS